MANSFYRAYKLAKYVKFQDTGQHTEAQFAADMARVAPHELERAGRTIARLRVRGAAAAVALPVALPALDCMEACVTNALSSQHVLRS